MEFFSSVYKSPSSSSSSLSSNVLILLTPSCFVFYRKAYAALSLKASYYRNLSAKTDSSGVCYGILGNEWSITDRALPSWGWIVTDTLLVAALIIVLLLIAVRELTRTTEDFPAFDLLAIKGEFFGLTWLLVVVSFLSDAINVVI